MSPLDSWTYALLLLLCALGIRSVRRSKQKPMAKFVGCLVLIGCAAMLIAEAIFRVWQFQLTRGF
jgi:hypothetical protein